MKKILIYSTDLYAGKGSFKESFLIFADSEKNDNEPFRLHIHEENSTQENKKIEPEKDKIQKTVEIPLPPINIQESISEPKTRPVMKYFKEISKEVISIGIIIVIIFLLLNWSAYYQIFKSKYEKLFGGNQPNILDEIGKPTDSGEQPVVETSQEELTELISEQKNEEKRENIPSLHMDVTPLSTRLIIPRINQNVPVIRVSSENLINRNWVGLEKEIQTALQNGVVHYPGTALPGQNGNVVITGHSSYFPWDPGRFKDVFAILNDLVVGDKIIVYHNQKKIIYKVTEMKIVLPKDIEVLQKTDWEQLTLITCYPVGTNLKRLIVIAKPIDENLYYSTENQDVSTNPGSQKLKR